MIQQVLAFESAEPVRQVAARLYAYLAAVDSGSERAAEHGFRQSIAIELALHAAATGDVDELRRWLNRAARRALAEAHLAIIEANPERARTLLAQAWKQLPGGMDPGLNTLTAEQIERVSTSLDRG